MIVVFPNHALKVNGELLLLEANHSLLFDALTAEYSTVGVAATVDVSDRPGGHRVVATQNIQYIPLWEVGENARKTGKIFAYLGMMPKILKVVSESDFCYIMTPGHVGLLAALACLVLKRPYALYLRGEWGISTPFVFLWVHRIIFRRAKFVICTGIELTKRIAMINPHCEAVVPMSGVLTIAVPPRTSYAITDKCRLLFVGQLVREKGIYELLEAMAMIGKQGFPNSELSIVGTGSELEQLQCRVNHLGLIERVCFHGVIDDADQLALLYSNHDLFCLPTYHEGFPRVIYEAMYFGLPIITTDVGQIGTIVHDNENGLFVKVRNPEDLAEKIVRSLEDDALRQRLGQQARATVEPMVLKWRATTHGHQVLRWMKEAKVRQ